MATTTHTTTPQDVPATYEVTIARSEFEYEPVAGLPQWWTPGQRQTARKGDTITVGQADYDRGRRYLAFADVPPLPSREVTVLHGCFTYTPQPFPAWEPEFLRRIAMRGDTVRVLEDEYQDGQRRGCFEEWKPASAYGVVGDPPLGGNVIALLNWLNAAPTEAVERLQDDLDELAASSAPARVMAAQVRATFTGPHATDSGGRYLSETVNRVNDLIRKLQDELREDDVDDLLAKVRDQLITNPDAVAALLSRTSG